MKKFNCPLCDETSIDVEGICEHIEEDHADSIPQGTSVEQFYYTWRTGKTHGNCIVCKRETQWNPKTNKFNRFCGREVCKEQYVEMFKKRMIGKYGKETLLNDPNQQKKMLQNRSISGMYKWSDGKHETPYTGSYEKDFLTFLDLFMEYNPDDVMMPSPHTYYYMYEGKEHFYIPDAFIPSLNLEIEIKDGGDNPNMHHKIQDVDKVKERLKDDVMTSQKEYSYIKLVDKKYGAFVKFLLLKKEEFGETGGIEKPLFILENPRNVDKESLKEQVLIESTTFNDSPERIGKVQYFLNLIEDIELEFGTNLEDYCNKVPYIRATGSVYELDDLNSYKRVNKNKVNPDGLFYDEIALPVDNLICEILDSTDEYVKEEYAKFQNSIMNAAHQVNDQFTSIAIRRDCIVAGLMLRILRNKYKDGTYRGFICAKAEDLLLDDVQSLLNDKAYDTDYVQGDEVEYYGGLLESAVLPDEVIDTDVYPVYVLLTHTGTALSNAIKKVTQNPYSHSSISFSPDLDEMYSFGRKYKSNPLIGTFVKENIREGLFEDVSETATYSLYVTFVKGVDYKKMMSKLEEFKQPNAKFKYNFIGLIQHQMGIPSERDDAYFCSQFVDTILKASSDTYFDRSSSLVKPYDFAKNKRFKFISKGLLKNYSVERVNAKVEKLLQEEKNK